MGFLTKTRQETGADKPKFGTGGNWLDIDAMIATETVFGITNVEYDDQNEWQGKPRPRWIVDVIPWYEGETLPGKVGDDGRRQRLDAGRFGLSDHPSRLAMMESIVAQLDEGGDEVVDGVLNSPGVLVKIRVPGGKGGKYTDLCEWDETNERAILSEGTEPATDEEPRRPTGRSAPARSSAPAPAARRRQAEPEEDEEQDAPPARRGAGSVRQGGASRRSTASASTGEDDASPRTSSSSGFADAGGAESDGANAVPAPAGLPVSQADLNTVSKVVGGPAYRNARELAEEYELEEGTPFPAIKRWLSDHGVDDYPAGRGRIKSEYRDAYSIALRCWMDHTGRGADGVPDRGEAGYVPGGPDHTASYNDQPGRQREVRPAEIPDNARETDQRLRPAEAAVRPENKAAWLPPDQRERGQQSASEHVYEPGDVGDSIDPCPGCQVVVIGRALPMGAGSYGIMHECPGDHVTRPLQATNIRRG